MKQLKKKTYQAPKRSQRRGLFGSTRRTNNEVEVEKMGEGGNECTICLEAFVPNEHVLVTSCKHMFHDGCITPWVKSHGKCPICRFAFCERTQSGAMLPNYSNTNNSNISNSNRRELSTGEAAMTGEELSLELLALIRAMEEAFNWVSLNSRAISFE
jgi:Ring finger domain